MRRAILIVIGLLAFSPLASAHDIPADATVHVFIKPEGKRLSMLVRVQMVSLQDIDWPSHKQDGTLDLPAMDPALRQAAEKWLGNRVDIFEESSKIEEHSLKAVRLSLDGDASFGTYEQAYANVTGQPLPSETKLLQTQGVVDVLYEYPIQSDHSDRKSTRLNSSHVSESRMPSSA